MFHVKIQLFVTAESDQDPDPDGSVLILLPGSGYGSGPALRYIKSWIRITPMRIRNTG